ncbi:hypothetical protein Patl1_00010 [Pistacia atlantica]|uniref:Uncharacterized protein n=1 Tax=Pistacia atlantica TaxID=434234 RepID=A0ACC1C5T6_9ROSI|nr:hypothetical protein Patl1_00010 [Pistacia atlantica]
MAQQDQVVEEKRSLVRILTLNRPRQLNALSFEMISRLLELLLRYENDSSVKLIIVKGKGRAFCAGGDVAAVVRDINQSGWRSGANFFYKEFFLNFLMATFTKPQVSFLNGIVMGGGAGASIHGKFRVATENSVFAMPETALGLFPDVGASYFLSRLPGFFAFGSDGISSPYNSKVEGKVMRFAHRLENSSVQGRSELPLLLIPKPTSNLLITDLILKSCIRKQKTKSLNFHGEYVGLTGARLDGAEMLACGLATHFVPSSRLSSLEEALCKIDSSDPTVISEIIDKYTQQPYLKDHSAYHRMDVIDKCFSRRTVEEILSSLERVGIDEADAWISDTVQTLKKASPTSLKISLRSVCVACF